MFEPRAIWNKTYFLQYAFNVFPMITWLQDFFSNNYKQRNLLFRWVKLWRWNSSFKQQPILD